MKEMQSFNAHFAAIHNALYTSVDIEYKTKLPDLIDAANIIFPFHPGNGGLKSNWLYMDDLIRDIKNKL